jgi:hypothetical protein
MRLRAMMAAVAIATSTLGVFAFAAPAEAKASCGAPLQQADWVRFICSGSGYAQAGIQCTAIGSQGHKEWFWGPKKATPAHVYADCPDLWIPAGLAAAREW